MTWKDTYDQFNMTIGGEVVFFGDHLTLSQVKRCMVEDNYDDPALYSGVVHVWLRFGFLVYDGEVVNGWNILTNKPASMRGCIKGTIVEVTQ